MSPLTTDILLRLSHQAGTDDSDSILARITIQKLPTVYSNLLHQRYVKGASVAQIASQCGCAEVTAIQWQGRAQEAFTRRLEADGAIPSTRRRSTNRTTRSLSSTDADRYQLLPLTKSNDGQAAPSLESKKGQYQKD